MYKFKSYINGIFIETDNNLEIISPLNNEVAGTVTALSKEEIDLAFNSAKNSYKSWSQTSINTRKQVIKEFNKLLLKNKNELSEIMNVEIGKDIREGITEVERTVEYIDKTVSAWDKIIEKTEVIDEKHSTQIRVPLGVVLAISPFNYPVNLSLAKIVPALLTGNTVVFKSATNGSLVGGFITTLFDKVNIPAGVFNFCSGRGREIGDTLTTHPLIDMITFTGSVGVGKRIAENTSMKPLVLELGGNDAAYIRKDANIDKSVKEVVSGAFGYAGQRCTAIKRLIIQEEIYNDVIVKVKQLASELNLNPLIDKNAFNFVKELYNDSIKRQDKIILDGKFNKNTITPIIIKTTKDSRVWAEEAFGPILPVIITSSDEEALELINDTNFGLQNSIFTEDIKFAKDFAKKIESGTVNINAKSSRGPDEFPFLGIKDSGFGVQGIRSALESMTRVLNIVEKK